MSDLNALNIDTCPPRAYRMREEYVCIIQSMTAQVAVAVLSTVQTPNSRGG